MVESEAPGSRQDTPDLRDRVAAAMIDLVLDRGYEAITQEALCERASVSAAAFEAHFADLQDCLIQVYVRNNDLFDEQVRAAYAAHERWRDALRAAAYAAADFIAEHPREVRFNTIAARSAGEVVTARRDVFLRQLVDLIDAGRLELDDPDSLARSAAESAIGSIYERLMRDISSGGDGVRAREVVPELMYIAVRPYLGHQEALKELSIPPPAEAAGKGRPKGEKQKRTESGTAVQSPSRSGYGARVDAGDPSGEKPAPGLSRLPPGRHGLPRDFVAQNQRDRLVAGIIAAVAEHGYHGATISEIAAAAGVSRRTFYAYFSSRTECYLATYDIIGSHLAEASRSAGASHREWPARVRAKLGAALELFAANPDLVRFYLGAPPRAGEEIAARYRLGATRVLADLTDGMPSNARDPSPAVQSALAGGMAALIVGKVEDGEGDRLGELLPDLTELFLTPYIGREAAVEVARRSS